jgi:hypothetical protein
LCVHLLLQTKRGNGAVAARWCIQAAVSLGVIGILAAGSWAKENPRGTTRAYFGGRPVIIEYGRPWLRGRNILTFLEPGQLWRLGADAPTTIESQRDLKFGDVRVPKGKHILLVRYIEPGIWSLVFSTAPAIDYGPSSRIAEALMGFKQGQSPVEQLAIHLSNVKGKGALEIAWGAYRLLAEFGLARARPEGSKALH